MRSFADPRIGHTLMRSRVTLILLGMVASGILANIAFANETTVEPAEALRILQQVQDTCQKGLPSGTEVKRKCTYSPTRNYSFWSQQNAIETVQSESHLQRDAARWEIKSAVHLIPSTGAASPLDFEQNTLWDGHRLAKWQSCSKQQGKESAEITSNAKRKDDLRKDPFLGYELNGILTHRDFEDIGHLMIRKEAANSARLVSKEGGESLMRFEAVSGLWHIVLWTEANADHTIRKIESIAQFKPEDDFRYAEGRETVTVTKTALVNGMSIPAEGTVETVKVLRPLQRTNNQSLLGWLWNKYTASLQERTRVSISRTFTSETSASERADAFAVLAAANTLFHCPDDPPKDFVWSGSEFVSANDTLPAEERLARGVRSLRISPTGPGAMEIGWLPSIPWVGVGVGCTMLAGAAWTRHRKRKRQSAPGRGSK